jgi:hypothetical protein
LFNFHRNIIYLLLSHLGQAWKLASKNLDEVPRQCIEVNLHDRVRTLLPVLMSSLVQASGLR